MKNEKWVLIKSLDVQFYGGGGGWGERTSPAGPPPGAPLVIDSAFSAILFPHVKKRSYAVLSSLFSTFSYHTCISIFPNTSVLIFFVISLFSFPTT